MKVVLQVVNEAKVVINDKLYNSINKGYLLFVGIGKDDNEENVKLMAKKIAKLRVFKDENDKTNLDIYKVNGEILSISQFTLYANTNGGNRPDFFLAADKDKAINLYNLFNKELENLSLIVKTGIFGADMKVSLENDGPFTILLEN
jgi:D-tyrosyl-tRNA(Tyr) deacylase